MTDPLSPVPSHVPSLAPPPDPVHRVLLDHLEESIAQKNLMIQSVLDAASEIGMITSGFDGTITLFSRGAEKMLGYRADEVVGRQTSALYLDPDEIDIWIDAMSVDHAHSDEANPHVNRTELNFIRKDGQKIRVELSVTPLNDSRGLPTGYLSICLDVTQQRAYESKLRQAMEEAQAAVVAKSQFLANMSHEIRTPMNAILGMLQVLRTTDLSAPQLDFASKAESAANSLLGLLNDILDFSKIDAGKMKLDCQPFRLDTLMRDLAVVLAGYAGAKPVEVLFDMDPQMPRTLVGDSLRLQQVLINLASNAIKFTPQGEVLVQLAVVAQNETSSTLNFSVSDTGIGIAPENLVHIFDDFSQAEASTTRRFGGTGLGLTISKRIVSLMGGDLSVVSLLGKGSNFHFEATFPTDASSDTQRDPAIVHLLHGLRVLIVDDNGNSCALLGRMVSSWGWTYQVADSGASAKAQVQERAAAGQAPFQLLIVDSHMPDMDGWATVDALLPCFSPDAVPVVIMLSAHSQHERSHRSAQEQSRLHAFLSKPITPSMLFDAVAQAVSAQRKPAAALIPRPAKVKRLEGVRLLVVEDNVVNQQVAMQLLKSEGAVVELAGNGQIALDAIAEAFSAPASATERPYAAVLMDLQMPVMDGLTATRIIRQTFDARQLPIIAMTANAMDSDRAACAAAGMNDHIGKPFKIGDVVASLHRHLGISASPASPPQ